MNTRGRRRAVPGAARRGGADPRLRRERSRRDLPRRRALRPRRVRGPATDGHHHDRQARRRGRHRQPGGRRRAREGGRAQGPPRAVETHCRRTQGQRSAGRGARAVGCRSRCRGAGAAVLGHPGRQGRRAGRLHRAARRAGAVPRAVGAARRARRRGTVVRGTGGDRGPAAAAVLAGPAVHRRHPGPRRGGVRILPRGVRGRRRHRARPSRNPMRPNGSGSPSRVSSATGSCASPTSSARASWPRNADRWTCCRSSW